MGESGAEDIQQLVPLLQAELNIKTVTFASSADDLVTLEAKPNFRALGKKFGKQTPLRWPLLSAAFNSDALRRFERGEELLKSL